MAGLKTKANQGRVVITLPGAVIGRFSASKSADVVFDLDPASQLCLCWLIFVSGLYHNEL